MALGELGRIVPSEDEGARVLEAVFSSGFPSSSSILGDVGVVLLSGSSEGDATVSGETAEFSLSEFSVSALTRMRRACSKTS